MEPAERLRVDIDIDIDIDIYVSSLGTRPSSLA